MIAPYTAIAAVSVLLASATFPVNAEDATSAKSSSKEVCEQLAEQTNWVRPDIAKNAAATYTDPILAESYRLALDRMTKAPLDHNFILADVNFNQDRRFINFSGDISGRFIEITSTVSTKENPWPETLMPVLDEIPQYQKADGHFGKEVDWSQPLDFSPGSDQTVMTPILWGNARLLLGLTEAARKFDHPKALAAAKKLGDFYVNTVYPRFCDPKHLDEYKTQAQYATAYVTCVYEGMEGLIQLYRLTHDTRYLETADKMATFHEQFDTLPTGHSHGSLSQTGALVMLYEDTNKAQYLKRAEARWEEAVFGGYVNPCGGVLEKFVVTGYNSDEGCAEADWLNLNLLLWANTGKTRYLDMAERLLWNAFLANQWSSGGFGHRNLGIDETGAYAFQKPVAESYWCCSYHGALALHKLRSYMAVGTPEGIYINFPITPFTTTIEVDGQTWNLKTSSNLLEIGGASEDSPRCADLKSMVQRRQNKVGIRIEITGPENEGTIPPIIVRMPDWADSGYLYMGQFPLHREADSSPRNYSTSSKTISYPALQGTALMLSTTTPAKVGMAYELEFLAEPYLEPRKFTKLPFGEIAPLLLDNPTSDKLKEGMNVVVRQGPFVYMNRDSGAIQDVALQLTLKKDANVAGPFCPVIPYDKMAPYILLSDKAEPHAFVFNAKTILLKGGIKTR